MRNEVRLALYCILFLSAAATLAMTAVRIHYTTRLSPHDPLHLGNPYHDLVAVELMVTSALTLPWALFGAFVIGTRRELRLFGSFAAELIVLLILNFLWLFGSGFATHHSTPSTSSAHWGNLSSCWRYWQCRNLTAMLGVAWTSWGIIFILYVLSFLFVSANKALWDPMHGRLDRRGAYGGPMRALP